MWQDRRTAELVQAMESYNPFVYGKSGLKISGILGAQMTWLCRNRPDIWQKTYKMIGIQDPSRYRLMAVVTINFCVEPTSSR